MASFKGEFKYTLDDKGRVNIPAKFRKQLTPEADETFTCIKGFESCIAVYPKDEWQVFERKLRDLEAMRRLDRRMIRTISSTAADEKYDRQGRIILPARLLEHAGITKDVIIIGVLERIEIWDPEAYEKYMSDADFSFEDVAEQIFRPDNGQDR